MNKLPPDSKFAITTPAPGNSSTASNPVELRGTAPMAVKDIRITSPAHPSGVIVPVTWSSVMEGSLYHWKICARLAPGANTITVAGLDRRGAVVPGAQKAVAVEYTGTDPWPRAGVFINEWMASNQDTLADPADSDYEDWFELYNTNDCPFDRPDYVLPSEDLSRTAKISPGPLRAC
jgi:hypothetical protein